MVTPVHNLIFVSRIDFIRGHMFTTDNTCSALRSTGRFALSTESPIGERLEQVRRTANASQTDFAASLGISRTTLHNYARGERDLTVPVLAKLLEVYQADPLWILDGDTGVQNREEGALQALGDILERVEERLTERGERLGTRKRWMIVCRLYTERLSAERRTGELPNLSALGLDNLLDMAQ
ncbi:helix-turn-helix transcriptional regulator [Leisingera sp. MMG026]|uniref:helix-turn-helix domain-containing protein n=1 Tax=Leisingera sp. MMG026 TaxID=2909982 RepID=UPI001F3E9C14|nr:helix-turn-helix transcriptional regulator [Leisingera sp. MMG026]MCF6430431.1 helix-turn-helix transcriptional regulator [Leisingera sp. MMG026]